MCLLDFSRVFVRFFSFVFFFKQKTAYEMRISDWSSDVCSSDLPLASRSKVMRLALGTPAPAFFMNIFMNQPLIPPSLPSGGGGLLVSATSTSPLGRT